MLVAMYYTVVSSLFKPDVFDECAVCLVHIPSTTPLRCAFFRILVKSYNISSGCRKVTLGTSYDFLVSQKPMTTSWVVLKFPRFSPFPSSGHLTINVRRFLPGYIKTVKTSHDDLSMHLRKRDSDGKVPAVTFCNVYGTQTLWLPCDDPRECEQTGLAP